MTLLSIPNSWISRILQSESRGYFQANTLALTTCFLQIECLNNSRVKSQDGLNNRHLSSISPQGHNLLNSHLQPTIYLILTLNTSNKGYEDTPSNHGLKILHRIY